MDGEYLPSISRIDDVREMKAAFFSASINTDKPTIVVFFSSAIPGSFKK